MKKIIINFCIVIVALICFGANCYALEFKAGTYYFDNSKLKFGSVKMVVGDNSNTTVYEMSPDSIYTSWFNTFIGNYITNLTGFCFIDSEKNSGTYNKSLQDFLNECDTTETDFRQTKIREIIDRQPDDLIGWVFCPLNDAPVSDGYWRPIDSYAATPSGTLPIIHINTENSQTVSSKDYYISGNLWIDNCEPFGFVAIGSEQNPLEMEIKGRGNYTWRASYKKPYKIKFASKQSPLDLDKSKHFILKPDFMDWSGYLRNETGFELSRQLGMPYTTRQYPVEVVLNGDYCGLYFLCEKIRIEDGRVEIMEQQDNETNPDNVTGGWLLELGYGDNQVISQHQGNDPKNEWFGFVSESPEILSQVQINYIHDFIQKSDSCIFVPDKNDNSWENYIDIDCLARFYIIHEVMENVEAFSGSLFLFKDYGWDTKLNFGPVWDFDNSGFNTTGDNYIFNYNSMFSFLWIRELLKFPHFQQKIRMVWKEFMNNNVLDKAKNHAIEWRNLIIDAEACDKIRWRTYASMHPSSYPAEYLDLITRKVAWLDEQWRIPTGDVNADGYVTSADVTAIYDYLLTGDESFLSTSDINGDGHVTSADVTAIYDILLGNQ